LDHFLLLIFLIVILCFQVLFLTVPTGIRLKRKELQEEEESGGVFRDVESRDGSTSSTVSADSVRASNGSSSSSSSSKSTGPNHSDQRGSRRMSSKRSSLNERSTTRAVLRDSKANVRTGILVPNFLVVLHCWYCNVLAV
jgi:cobalamin biosynthesis Mg chelatase CobN